MKTKIRGIIDKAVSGAARSMFQIFIRGTATQQVLHLLVSAGLKSGSLFSECGLKKDQIAWASGVMPAVLIGVIIPNIVIIKSKNINKDFLAIFRHIVFFYYFLINGFFAPCTSKCKWHPVDLPVVPIFPINWPWETYWPLTTDIWLKWAYKVDVPLLCCILR